MRYLFVVTGIGYGHCTRDLSIINEIKKRDRKAKVLIAGYANSYDFFKRHGFDTIKIEGEDFSGEEFKFKFFRVVKNNWNLPVKWTRDIFKIISAIKEFKADYVVVDWEPVGVIASAITKTKSVVIFNYDLESFLDFAYRFKLSKSRVIQHQIVSNIYLFSSKYSKAIFIPSLKRGRKGSFYFVDFMVRQKPGSLALEQVLLGKLKLKKRPILVMLGGTNYGNALFSRMLKFLYLYDEDFLVFGYKKRFVRRNVRSLGFKDNYLEYLKVSKGVICLAGHSGYEECVIFKKPCLVFPIIDHVEQTLNALEIEKMGFARVCYLKNLNNKQISAALKDFILNLEKLSINARKLRVVGDGARQIASFLLKHKD